MWVIYLEMGVAFTLLILIVWWTWPAQRADKNSPQAQHGAQETPETRKDPPR